MSNAGKSPMPDPNPIGSSLSFEEAVKKLEAIVEAMENADLPLDSLLAQFEEGAQLVQMCQSKLADAELKIQQLEKTAAGQMVLKSVSVPQETLQA